MRVDWNDESLESVPFGESIDWADPTHVPCMVAEAVYEIGNLSECLSDEEHIELCSVAIDAMPAGRDAILKAVQDRCYELATANGWSEWLVEPHSGRHAWDDGGAPNG